MNAKLDEILDIAPIEIIEDPEIVEVSADSQLTIPADDVEKLEQDFDAAREMNLELIDTGKVAIELAMRISQGSEDYKSIEALASLINSLSNVSKNLANLHKEKAAIKGTSGKKTDGINNGAQIGTQQFVFNGTSAELTKIIHGEK